MEPYYLVFCLITLFSSVQLDKIVFPGDTVSDSEIHNNNKRIPVSGNTKCPNDKYLYYPGDQENDWVCDCKPAYVYYPERDDCFPVYKQGPCNTNQYLILPEKAVVPECVPNPCRKDGEVVFNNRCEKLYTSSPCQHTVAANLKSSILDVNETTLEIECIPASSVELSIINVDRNPCPPGSKRVSEGQCRKIVVPKSFTKNK